MTNAAALRERASELRVLAREYAPEVGRPLVLKAAALERLAADLERNGLERRQPRRTLKELALLQPRRTFGRRQVALGG